MHDENLNFSEPEFALSTEMFMHVIMELIRHGVPDEVLKLLIEGDETLGVLPNAIAKAMGSRIPNELLEMVERAERPIVHIPLAHRFLEQMEASSIAEGADR